jgi:hypothetical protein
MQLVVTVIHMQSHSDMCVCVYIYICVYIHMYIYIYKRIRHNIETLVGQRNNKNWDTTEFRVPQKSLRVPFWARVSQVSFALT